MERDTGDVFYYTKRGFAPDGSVTSDTVRVRLDTSAETPTLADYSVQIAGEFVSLPHKGLSAWPESTPG